MMDDIILYSSSLSLSESLESDEDESESESESLLLLSLRRDVCGDGTRSELLGAKEEAAAAVAAAPPTKAETMGRENALSN